LDQRYFGRSIGTVPPSGDLPVLLFSTVHQVVPEGLGRNRRFGTLKVAIGTVAANWRFVREVEMISVFGAFQPNRRSTEAGDHCLRPGSSAFNVFSRPALLFGIGTRPSHDGVQ
jgi:hypothetical protein